MYEYDDIEQEPVVLRQINTTPKKRWRKHWKKNMLYPLYSVVENNGTVFISITGKAKDEPYVIYNKDADTFVANEGWEIVELSADSRITAMGGSAGEDWYVKPEGGIPVSDLSSAAQSSLTKAESSYQKPASGIPVSDMALSVRESLENAVKFVSQTLTNNQKAQARANIGIIDMEYDALTESIIFPPLSTSVSYDSITESIVFN